MRGIWEHNGIGGILWSEDYPGASGRGKTLQEAKGKLLHDIQRYQKWCALDKTCPKANEDIVIVQEKDSTLQVQDADSDVLFDSERNSLHIEDRKSVV